MQKKLKIFLTTSLMLITLFSIQSMAQKKQKQTKSTLTPACIACLNLFSPDTLTFTSRADSCPNILARCMTSTSTSQCEGIINECFAYNCQEEGSCANETANRNLAYGCLKAEGSILPYKCSSYIAALSKNYADQVKAKNTAKEQAYQAQLKQQQAQIAAQEAAAKQAEADAKVKAAQAEAQAQAELAKIEAENKLKLQQQEAELAQKAKDAELARQQKAAADARNNKPNVKYNNILAEVKKDISSAKTYTTKAFNMLGITKTNEQQANGTFFGFPAPIVEVYAISIDGSAKSQAMLNGSRYKETTNFKCTKDVKESYIKNELNNAYNVLLQSRDKLSSSITELENLNVDAVESISTDKINSLYALLNKENETINSLEMELAALNTTCETRCAGISSSMTSSSELQFDENGLIIEDSGNVDYKCDEFNNESSSNTNMTNFLTMGKLDIQSVVGGIGQKVTDLTKRVLTAVLNTDRLLEELNISASTGSVAASNMNYAVINSCTQYIMDIEQYTTCIKNVMSSQLSLLAQHQNSQKTQYYNTLLSEFAKSINTALDLVNSDTYRDVAKCDNNDTSSPGCGATYDAMSAMDMDTARKYALNLSSRLSKAANKHNIQTNNSTSGSINILNVDNNNNVTFSAYGVISNKEVNSFIKEFCPTYASWTATTSNTPYVGSSIILKKSNETDRTITPQTFNDMCIKK